MIKQSIEMQCDLCKHPAVRFDHKKTAFENGWIEVGQESYFEERSFFDSHICPDCVQKISALIKK